jgi:hypothetical protein
MNELNELAGELMYEDEFLEYYEALTKAERILRDLEEGTSNDL